MRRAVLLLAGVLLCVVALGSDSPKEYDDKTMVDPLEGRWQMIEWTCDGEKLNGIPEERVYHNGTYTINWSDGDTWRGSYRIDPTRKSSHLDWIPSGGSGKGQTFMNIYQVDGDTLRIAAVNGKQHPQCFKDKGVYVTTYKRVK
jgi:uncharacterized protein (TIGR03067 family)